MNTNGNTNNGSARSPEGESGHIIDDPCGQGVLLGTPLPMTGAVEWRLQRHDGTELYLGTLDEIAADIARYSARLIVLDLRRDELVTQYPALKSVGRTRA